MLFSTRSPLRPHPLPSLDTLIAVSYTKIDMLSHLMSGSKEDADFLRRGVLIQNALQWGIEARERERRQRSEESVFGMTSRRKSGWVPAGGWRGQAFENGMDALFEQDSDGDSDDDVLEIVTNKPSYIESSRDTTEVLDPTEFVTIRAVEEGEEAWFEQTWNELQSVTSPEHHLVPMTIATAQDVQVYPVEDDDSVFSPSTSGASSRSTTPSPPPITADFDLIPPVTPRLRATRIQDKLDGPMERGTLAPALESGMTVEQILQRYEIMDDDEELELDSAAELFDQAAQPIDAIISDSDDVPDFETDLDSDEDMSDHISSVASTPWLVTPTEDVLDDFGSGGSFEDLYQFGFDQASAGMFGSRHQQENSQASQLSIGWKDQVEGNPSGRGRVEIAR